MKNYIQPGENLTLPAPYAVAAGEGCQIGAIFGVVAGDALEDEDCDLVTKGVFNLSKVTANVFAIGAAAYWDNTAKLITSTSSGNTRVGAAVAAAGNGDATADIRLNGSF